MLEWYVERHRLAQRGRSWSDAAIRPRLAVAECEWQKPSVPLGSLSDLKPRKPRPETPEPQDPKPSVSPLSL